MAETAWIFRLGGGYNEVPFITSWTEASYRRVLRTILTQIFTQLCRRHVMCFRLCQHRLFHDEDDPWFCINRQLWNSWISRIPQWSGAYSLWRSEERATSRLAEELTQRPCLKLFIFKGHDLLVFQAAFHIKSPPTIPSPWFGDAWNCVLLRSRGRSLC